MNATRPTNATILGLLIALMIGTPAVAQSVWLGPGREAEVALEVLRPDFDGGDVTFFSSAVFLSGRYPLSDAVDVVAEIPVSHLGRDSSYPSCDLCVVDSWSETALGNPYVGIAFGARGASYGELGVRLPIAHDDRRGLGTGFMSDHNRWEAFFEDILTIRGAGNYLYRNSSGFRARLYGGSSVWVYTEDFGEDSVELLADYGAHAWYQAHERVEVGVGLTGRIIVSESDFSLSERMLNQVGLVVIGRFGYVHPGVHFRVPFSLSEDRDEASYVLGLSLAVPLAP
jgi:hypothetical protein